MSLPKEPAPRDLQALAAAYLCSQGTVLQKDIASVLEISQPEVSRLLKHATDEQWLATAPRLRDDTVPNGWMDRMLQHYFSFPRLRKHLQEWAPEGVQCQLFVCQGDSSNFYEHASRHVIDLLQQSRLVGLSFGRTIFNIVEALAVGSQQMLRKCTFQCIPVCGEPMHLVHKDRDWRYQSSSLVARLMEVVTGNPVSEMPLLGGVPAYIPSSFKQDKAKIIREFIATIPGYRQIFGSGDAARDVPEPLINTVDTILTGVGMLSDSSEEIATFIRERVLQEADVQINHLRQWIFGDISGILIPRPGLSKPDAARVHGMNERWVGMKLDDLRACARRASVNRRPGVMVIALQPQKAEIIREAVTRGLVNHLIVHHSLAKELERLGETNRTPLPLPTL